MEGQGSLQHLAVNVQVDPKLAAGRGEEFSADAQIAKKRQEWEALLEDEDSFRIPIGSRVEDSLDTSGLQTASLHDSIPQWNKGFQMLQKMGWKGRGLGRSEDGITEPVRGGVEAGLRIGLGKQQQDDFYTAADNVSRRQLEVELQACEPEERTRRREDQVARDQAIAQDVHAIRRNLYCQTCHKQYSSASELETHLSSYDHHHKKRLIEMRADELERTKRERERRERKRMDREAAKLNAQIQRAHGDQVSEPQDSAAPPLPPPLPAEPFLEAAGPKSHAPVPAPPAPPPPPPEEPPAPPAAFSAAPRKAFANSFGSAAAKRGRLKPAVAAFQMDADNDV